MTVLFNCNYFIFLKKNAKNILINLKSVRSIFSNVSLKSSFYYNIIKTIAIDKLSLSFETLVTAFYNYNKLINLKNKNDQRNYLKIIKKITKINKKINNYIRIINDNQYNDEFDFNDYYSLRHVKRTVKDRVFNKEFELDNPDFYDFKDEILKVFTSIANKLDKVKLEYELLFKSNNLLDTLYNEIMNKKVSKEPKIRDRINRKIEYYHDSHLCSYEVDFDII